MAVKSQKVSRATTVVFLAVQAVLYYFILTADGSLLKWTSYASIVLCFLFALLHYGRENRFIILGLACTVGADYFLVAAPQQQQLWGMVFFLAAQGFYAVYLNSCTKNEKVLTARAVLTAFAVAVTFAVLGKGTDALAVISMCYYANLIINISESALLLKQNIMFMFAFILFLLCDTVIGLQVMLTDYISAPGGFLYNLVFSGFNLAWFFYLPSQVLLALTTKYGKKPAEDANNVAPNK